MAMDKAKKENNFCYSWWTYIVYLWYNPNSTTIQFWENIRSIWWILHHLFNSLGNGDRQKEARQIRVNWICNSSSRSSCNILYAKIDASKNSNRHYHQNHPNDSFQIALAEMLSEIATSYEVFLDNSKYPGNIIL
jgi:hypothetical protein